MGDLNFKGEAWSGAAFSVICRKAQWPLRTSCQNLVTFAGTVEDVGGYSP